MMLALPFPILHGFLAQCLTCSAASVPTATNERAQRALLPSHEYFYPPPRSIGHQPSAGRTRRRCGRVAARSARDRSDGACLSLHFSGYRCEPSQGTGPTPAAEFADRDRLRAAERPRLPGDLRSAEKKASAFNPARGSSAHSPRRRISLALLQPTPGDSTRAAF